MHERGYRRGRGRLLSGARDSAIAAATALTALLIVSLVVFPGKSVHVVKHLVDQVAVAQAARNREKLGARIEGEEEPRPVCRSVSIMLVHRSLLVPAATDITTPLHADLRSKLRATVT